MVRAKFKCYGKKEFIGGSCEFEFYAVKNADPASGEDYTFGKSTPTGNIKITIANPAAIEKIKVGKDYYIDFIPVEPNSV